ncbi:MAG: hypothetical protein EZS28_002658 [Streblomastix strix]|uniref:ABC3 transporter permease C-terminal domain-containing protein n=1 Tax=Streblomastix strix TaxID=222440 RepID=A0A5J4X5K8_9EUKA|nr:MAG: hypothetical protein EZS28_002658 [Streblomastix strix]
MICLSYVFHKVKNTKVHPLIEQQENDVQNEQELKPIELSISKQILSQVLFFVMQSLRETNNRLCSFIWGFSSILLVVTVISVVISITQKFPVISFMMAEQASGQVDMELVSSSQTQKRGINSTKIDEILSQIGDNYNRFSPRIVVQTYTSNDKGFTLTILDSQRERELGIGREWVYTEPIPAGAAIITQDLASSLKIVETAFPYDLQYLLPIKEWTQEDEMKQRSKYKSPLYDYAQSAIFALPNPRTDVYLTYSTTEIRKQLIKWSSPILYALKFDQLQSSTNLINMDTRTFELGILRMIGLDRIGLVGLLITQALLYAVPGIILGIVFAEIINVIIMYKIEDISMVPLSKGIPALSFVISILVSLAITIIASIFPIRSALSQNLHDSIDVQHIKTKLIVLQIERADELKKPWSFLISGIILISIGTGIYIMLPYSLISGNTTIFAIVLFALLFMILIGLVIFTVNFEFAFEKLMSTVFLFWENRIVRTLSVKNLVVHRLRNRKATLQFSISLSFIVFINVMLKVLVQFVVDRNYHRNGADFHAQITEKGQTSSVAGSASQYQSIKMYIRHPEDLERIIRQNYFDIVEYFNWATHTLEQAYPYAIRSRIENVGRSHSYNHQLIGVTSSFMDHVRHINLDIQQTSEKRKLGKHGNGLYPIKQLYTHRAKSFSTVLSNGFKNDIDGQAGQNMIISLIPVTQQNIFTLTNSQLNGLLEGNQIQSDQQQTNEQTKRLNVSVQAFMKAQPFFGNPPESMTVGSPAEAPLSIPAYLSLFPDGEQDYDQLKWNDVFIDLRKEGQEEYYGQEEEEEEETESEDEDKERISSMSTNVMEQSKEIGIMRALGLQRFQLVRIYVEEAFILVITAAVMGIIVGLVLGYILASQIGMLKGIPIQLVFPWEVVLIAFLMAILISTLASAWPSWKVANADIVKTMKC